MLCLLMPSEVSKWLVCLSDLGREMKLTAIHTLSNNTRISTFKKFKDKQENARGED
jgi:hypothetical protein